MFFVDRARKGIAEWPFKANETQGYIVRTPSGELDLVPSKVFIERLPEKMSSKDVVGSFHSHPYGCSRDFCYYQPPSVQDFRSLRNLTEGPLTLNFHIIVTAKCLFVVTMTVGAPERRFREMIGRLEALKGEQMSPQDQQPVWFDIVNSYRDVVSVKTVPLINKKRL